MTPGILVPFCDPYFTDIPNTPVVARLMRNGYGIQFDRVMYVWRKPVTGTGEEVSIAYDGPTEIGTDPFETEYHLGRYSNHHGGYYQVHGLYDLDTVLRIADLLMSLPVIPEDEQIDYADEDAVRAALAVVPAASLTPCSNVSYAHPYLTEGVTTVKWAGTPDELADHLAHIWGPSVLQHLRRAISFFPA